MKIVTIFADRLFAFHYENEAENELRRLLNNWNTPSYLVTFLNENKTDLPKHLPVEALSEQIIENASYLDEVLYEISLNKSRSLEEFFKPLYNQEYRIAELSRQKGRKNYLRLYAIKIDKNCFVVTGGTIKFHHLNEDRPHTQIEMRKINKCRDYLKSNGVFDADSFFEFLND